MDFQTKDYFLLPDRSRPTRPDDRDQPHRAVRSIHHPPDSRVYPGRHYAAPGYRYSNYEPGRRSPGRPPAHDPRRRLPCHPKPFAQRGWSQQLTVSLARPRFAPGPVGKAALMGFEGFPLIVGWELTLACNLRCRHCASSAGLPRDNELTIEESLAICDQFPPLLVQEV